MTNASLIEEYGTQPELDHDAVLHKASLDVRTLTQSERRHLVNFWSDDCYRQGVDDLIDHIEYASSKQHQVSNIHDEVDRRVLQEAASRQLV